MNERGLRGRGYDRPVEAGAVALQDQQRMRTHVDQVSDDGGGGGGGGVMRGFVMIEGIVSE